MDKFTPGQVIRESERRYLVDPLFHARVDTAIGTIKASRMFTSLSEEVLFTASCVGLMMADVNPEDWVYKSRV